jgi:hypothetical protein
MKRVALMLSALLAADYSGCALAAVRASQETFKSPEEASAALFAAVRDRNEPAVARILGAGSELLSSGNAAEDNAGQQRFVQKYQEMHRLARETRGDRLLYIGAENWPFPVPLTERNGAWQFDTDAGRQEIQFRRIGEDEVTAIALCHTLLAAAKSGGAGASDNLTAEVLTAAKDDKPVAFHGYTFRMLSTPSGLGFVAYPAAYGISGVMTLAIGPDDSVRQKDLGPNTTRVASAINGAELDPTWTAAEPSFQGSTAP